MHQPLPTFAPLFAPTGWWRIYLRKRLEGLDKERATAEANRESGIKARSWMRFRAEGDAVLALPVEGGASTLKNRHPDTWVLAREAERDIPKILTTLSTLYGRTPFFQLLRPDILTVSTDENPPGPRATAREICTAAFEWTASILNLDDDNLLGDIRRRTDEADPRLRAVVDETPRNLRAEDASIIHPLFHLGPDAIFILIPPF